jgi:hypothetical protein
MTTRADVEAEFSHMINAHQKAGAVDQRCAELGITGGPVAAQAPDPVPEQPELEEDDGVLFDDATEPTNDVAAD